MKTQHNCIPVATTPYIRPDTEEAGRWKAIKHIIISYPLSTYSSILIRWRAGDGWFVGCGLIVRGWGRPEGREAGGGKKTDTEIEGWYILLRIGKRYAKQGRRNSEWVRSAAFIAIGYLMARGADSLPGSLTAIARMSRWLARLRAGGLANYCFSDIHIVLAVLFRTMLVLFEYSVRAVCTKLPGRYIPVYY